MVRLRTAAVVLVLLISASSLHAQIRNGPRGTVVTENYTPNPLTSGTLIRGLTNEAPPDTASAVHVIVNIPPSSGTATPAGAEREKLCILLYTYNGTYEALYSYPLPPSPGWYRLLLPTTQYADTLRRLGPAHISPLAFISRDCTRRMETDVHLAALFGTGIGSHRIQVRVLAAGADFVRIARPRASPSLLCDRTREFAYNFRCAVDLSPYRGQWVVLAVQRHDGLNVTSERMNVWGGP
jgi:hypothetical protein